MKQFLSLIFLLIQFNAVAQTDVRTLITTAGDSYKNNAYQLNWSIGEIMIETYTGNASYLNQGFHQSEYEIKTSINEPIDKQLKIRLYPNPSSKVIYLQINEQINTGLTYQLVNIEGKVLFTKAITKNIEKLLIEHFPAGLYFIKIIDKTKKIISTFKIQKVN